jgi:hypothetical protein
MMVLPVVIIAIIAGLAFSGVIDIPGISPKKAAKNAVAAYTDKDEKLAENKPATPPPAKKEEPKKDAPKAPAVPKDPEQGADALAAVWNEIPVNELMKITANWKDEDLTKVLMHMETEKVAQLLQLMAAGDQGAKVDPKPERASKLSKILQDQGSMVKLQS